MRVAHISKATTRWGRLATASNDTTAKVWDAESGKELLTLCGHSYVVLGVAFSPDGKRLATASDDNTAKVRDTESGQQFLTLRCPSYGVAYSPDSKRLATACCDNTPRVWNAESGKELLILRGHTGPVTSVAFSPDGNRLATASDDGTIQIYILDIHQLLDLARSRDTLRPPGLTPEECKSYFQTESCQPLA